MPSTEGYARAGKIRHQNSRLHGEVLRELGLDEHRRAPSWPVADNPIVGLQVNNLRSSAAVTPACPVPSSPADKARRYGFSRLIHYTALENLPAILSGGAIKTPLELGRSTRGYVYDRSVFLSLPDPRLLGTSLDELYSSTSGARGCSLDRAVVVFGLGLLDRPNYHAMPIWAYGDTVRGCRRASTPDTIEDFLQAVATGHASQNEVVVYEAVPLSRQDFVEIWVHPSRLSRTLAELRRAGISSFNGRRIDTVIVPRTVFP
jgi:hypothetical protein